MKTPMLFDVPKTHPSRKDRINAFKAQHGIETHYCAGMSRAEEPWSACHMPTAREMSSLGNDADIGDVVAKYCRILDERGVLVIGPTERQAIKTLCENMGIDCDL